jgi:hydroxymethylbilane synthase
MANGGGFRDNRSMIVRVGTRGSPLARAQTRIVLEDLRRAHPRLTFDVREIRTRGDEARGPVAELEGTGFFTAEIERALLRREIDLAVHSLKDLPTESTPGLSIAAVPRRAAPFDALVSYGPAFDALPPGARVGTSSPRRAAQIRSRRLDLQVVPLRGNVDTRLRKVRDGAVEAAVVAAAGFERLGLAHELAEVFPADLMLPAPAQGALAVQTRDDDISVRAFAAVIDHAPSRAATIAERAFLRRLEGGCALPAAALAVGEERLTLRALVASETGVLRFAAVRFGSTAEAARMGEDAAEEILRAGIVRGGS